MGSVSSLVKGNSLDSKHCKASEHRLKPGMNPHRKSGGCSLDALLKCGFTQGSSASTHPSRGLAHSQSGRSEDFFYIKVSHKQRLASHRGSSMEDHAGGKKRDEESDEQPLMSGRGSEKTSAEKSLIRSSPFKPVIPKKTSSGDAGRSSLDRILCPLEKPRSPDRHKQDNLSGTLSDSGRNSMSSLPTHSTSGSLSASTAPTNPSDGSSALSNGLGKGVTTNFPPWVNRNTANLDCSHRHALKSGGLSPKVNVDDGSPLRTAGSSPLCETSGGIRSPLTADESMIEHLEQRLLERETELQELQVSCEEKGVDTCHLFDDPQRCRTEDTEGLKQRCSTKLQQVSQIATNTQHALQRQVKHLQTEKEKLQEEIANLTREKELLELRLSSYETNTQLAPTLEETQWEVCQKTGEISLLKQQLRDCQADVSLKRNEIVSLRASLKENAAKMELLEKQSRDHEHKLHSRSIEVEVCQNELQRKKNEAVLLREKVGKLETDIQGMKQDVGGAKEQLLQHSVKPDPHAQTQGLDRLIQGSDSLTQNQEEANSGHVSADLLQREVERLRRQLIEEKATQEKLANSFEQERQTWNKEKSRVIKYQKQLQLNYLQMHKKNQDLERLLKEVAAELESRTELGVDINRSAGFQTYDDVIATEI